MKAQRSIQIAQSTVGHEQVLLTTHSGIDDVNTIVAGHSHTFCCYPPILDGGAEGFAALWAREIDDEYWSSLCALCEGKNVALIWMGNQHNARLMFSDLGYFDVCLGDEPVIEGATIVAEELIRAQFLPTLTGLTTIIDQLKDANARKVFVVGTPAARGTPDQIRTLFIKEGFHVALAEKMGLNIHDVPICPLSVRIKLWRILQAQMNELADAAKATFISTPSETYGEDGALLNEYWNNDATHANHSLGKKLIEQIGRNIDR